MDNTQYKGPVCRGCWALGNNCKICERCVATKPTTTGPRPTEAFAHPLLVEALRDAGASLAAAISLLERGGKAAKKAAPSDRMFDQMVKDYKASLTRARAALSEVSQ